VAAPPVPVERLIQLRGARLAVRSLEDSVSGFVYRDEGQPVIGINTVHPLARQRFTMAHELGHLILHNALGVHIDERDFFLKFRDSAAAASDDREEREANLFAAELLMPREFLEKDATQLGEISLHDDGALRHLAKRYGVSLQALLIRLTSLRLLEHAALA
jgi:Zn-dependent peptidase ImmA (M78 family)